MSKKGYFVADPDNFIQKNIMNCIEEEIEKEEAFLRVCYPSNDSRPRNKTRKITKILNKEKPKLFQKYVQNSQNIFIDLIYNEDKERDVELVCNALKKKKNLDEDPTNVVLISSFKSWNDTNPFSYYLQNHPGAFEKYLKKINLPNMFPTEVQNHLMDNNLEEANEDQEINEENTLNDKSVQNEGQSENQNVSEQNNS